MASAVIVTTSDFIEGRRVAEYLGVLRGVAIRVPTMRQGFQTLGNVLSGNLQAGIDLYAELCETARGQAYQKLSDRAHELGADAVIAMRYDTSDIGETAAEVVAYGTAVKL